MSFVYGHEYMGELQLDGKRYFLKYLRFEEFAKTGKQTWTLENVDTGEELDMEYLPNQRRKMEHDIKMRQYTEQVNKKTDEQFWAEIDRAIANIDTAVEKYGGKSE